MTVNSVTAADTSVVVGGTATDPTVRTNTLDVIAADHPAAANWSNNSKKITSLANGSAASDAAAFGQVPPTWAPADQGLLAWNLDPGYTGTAGSALTNAGTLFVMAVKLALPANITNIIMFLAANGGTLTTGQCFAALYQGAGGALLGTTADQASAWGAGAPKLVTMPLSGGPFAAAAGVLYVALWWNGTTGPAFSRYENNAAKSNVGLAAAASRWGTADTGRTTTAPPTLGAISAAGTGLWAALS